jgi:hypothetical protein
MEIANSTDHDAQYRITGNSGPPIGHRRPEDFMFAESDSWPTLHAGAQISHTPKSSGPWTVYFYVNGRGFVETLNASDGRLTLMRSGKDFHVQRD